MSVVLKEITLTNFKNYTLQKIQFSDSVNCIVGNNGMGKTNLLDAIYYLCMTKSHFGLNDRNILKKKEAFFRLEGWFTRNGKNEKIVAKVIPGKKKDIERNAVPYNKMSEHIGFLPIVIIAPDDTALAREGSEMRRRFIDNTLSQQDADYLKNLIVYNKVLRQRNATLKQFTETGQFDFSLINTYNQQLIPPGNIIHEKRKRFESVFFPVFEHIYKKISGDKEQVSCSYASPLLEKDFESILNDNIEKDRIMQRTTSGVHKDDLIFKINNLSLKNFASQGQLKSYIFALKLAQYSFLRTQKKVDPILLLDDLFDKLDEHRVLQLLHLLLDEEYGQVFISDTDIKRLPEMMERLDVQYNTFVVKDGAI